MKLYNREDLKDSRLFFDKNPPAFMIMFIVFCLVLLIFGVFVVSNTKKNYIVDAQGTITTTDNKYVGVLMNGVIIELKKNEGDKVEKGDVLFTISSGTEGSNYSALSNQYEVLLKKESAMNKFQNALESGVNNLSNEGEEQGYYGKMEYYLTIAADGKTSYNNTQETLQKLENKSNQSKAKIESYGKEISGLDTTAEEGVAMKEELESKLESEKANLESIEDSISQTKQELSNSQAYQTKMQLLSELGTERSTNENSKAQIQAQMDVYKNEDSLYEVKSSNNGVVHYFSTIKEGMYLQQSTTIAEISENNQEDMILEAYIQQYDISKIKKGQKVNIALEGVNIQKYGVIEGRVKEIDIGTTQVEISGEKVNVYRCEISLNNKELKAKNGDTVRIIKSMNATAQIVYNKETYLDYLLNLLSLKN